MKVYLPIFIDKAETQFLSLIREDRDLELLSSLLDPSIEVITGTALPNPPDYDIVVSGRPDPKYISEASQLEALVIPFAGLPDTTRDLMLHYPNVAVHNLHFNADETAELALALLMATAKNIVPIDQKMRSNNWSPRYEKPSASELLAEKLALILGFGAIGQRLTRMCQAMGMRVVALKRNANTTANSVSDLQIDSIENLHKWLPESKSLLIALPLTPETENLIDSTALDLLPPHAIIVNIGRAKIIDEEALYSKLKSGVLRAGLDVWYNYPSGAHDVENTVPSQFPFHELPNVVMSPHRGGHCREMQDRRMAALAEVLNRAARGVDLPNRVNLKLGY